MRRSILLPAVVLLALASACAPTPAPGPSWHATRFARSSTATATVNTIGAWTDADWFATIRTTAPPGGAATAELRVSPRTGPGGSTLGAPQVVPLPDGLGAGPPTGEHVLAIAMFDGLHLYRPTGGTWGPAGTITLPPGYVLGAMTDRWLVLRHDPGAELVGDADLLVYAVDTSGPTVTATLATTLQPDPTWSSGLREGFGAAVSLDGGLLAVTATPGASGGGPLVRIYREQLGSWSAVQTIGDTVGLQRQTGVMAVDDGPTVDRLVLSPFITSLQTPAVDVWADSGAGFVPEQHLQLDTALADASGGNVFGSSVAIEGDLLAVTSRSVTVPSAQGGHDPVTVGFVQLYRHGVAWAPEHEAGLYVSPYDAGVRTALPFRLQAAAGHVAAAVLASLDEPPGCPFPCIAIGLEAWSLDRR